ncbi:MAG: ABC transporter substrate-binding protein [Actinobacteria bacterium]|nr:ABC transporter substrate-binding protein [Actinomycetota bacterium]
MRSNRNRVFGAILAALALIVAACGDGSGEGADIPEGPTINVASFNFPESVILAEIYAQAMEDRGFPVERNLNLGSRELIFPEIEGGDIDFIPEYLGSAITVGFGETAPNDTEEATLILAELFGEMGVTVLEPAPGQDKNVFVVTGDFADENGVSTVQDLSGLGDVTLGGPPECEERETCYAGLVETYGLDNLQFEAIQEGAARVAALEAGDIQVALLFSTQPVITERGFVALEGTEEIIAPENIIPVVNQEVIDAYGDVFRQLINSISAEITTDVLLDLNGRVELEAQNPDDVARDWLVENGFIEEE